MSRSRVRFRWNGRFVSNKVREAAGEGLYEAAEHLLEHSNRTVPLEEGTLMRSGQTDVDRENLKATVSYDTPYARAQHENLEYRHDPGRRAKWLEQTGKERERQIREHVHKKIKDALKG